MLYIYIYGHLYMFIVGHYVFIVFWCGLSLRGSIGSTLVFPICWRMILELKPRWRPFQTLDANGQYMRNLVPVVMADHFRPNHFNAVKPFQTHHSRPFRVPGVHFIILDPGVVNPLVQPLQTSTSDLWKRFGMIFQGSLACSCGDSGTCWSLGRHGQGERREIREHLRKHFHFVNNLATASIDSLFVASFAGCPFYWLLTEGMTDYSGVFLRHRPATIKTCYLRVADWMTIKKLIPGEQVAWLQEDWWIEQISSND